jgi:hypothetical protein
MGMTKVKKKFEKTEENKKLSGNWSVKFKLGHVRA